MVERCIIDRDKMLISKPGFDVTDVTLGDENKIFDSRWPFVNMIIADGFYGGAEYIPVDGKTTVFPFPNTGSIPLLEIAPIPYFGSAATVGNPYPSDNDVVDIGSINYSSNIEGFLTEPINIFDDRFELKWLHRAVQPSFEITRPFKWFVYAIPSGEQ